MEKQKNLQLKEYDVTPTAEVLEQVLKDSYFAYETFQEALPNLDMEQNWQWYTPHKAWFAKGQYWWTNTRGTRKEKNLYWLYVYEGYFTVAIWFKEKNRTEVLKCNVSEKTKKIICDAKTHTGVPTFPVIFDITNTESFTDIYTLIECKKAIE